MSDKLINKYRKDRLTPEEATELRHELDTIDDAELTRRLLECWEEDDSAGDGVSDSRISRIRSRVDSVLGFDKPSLRLRLWFDVVAAVLLPLLLLTSVYFYFESRPVSVMASTITTVVGERAAVTLPDSTVVSLSEQSRLAYGSDYMRGERRVIFDGEAHFNVAKFEGRPFTIESDGLQTTVHGTVFNLKARADERTAVLTLERGSVSLLAVASGQSATLVPGQEAVIDRTTGKISVSVADNPSDASAWMRHEITFRRRSLSAVIQELGRIYGTKIVVHTPVNDTFTGTLPTDDLAAALDIVAQAYGFKTTIGRDRVELSPQ